MDDKYQELPATVPCMRLYDIFQSDYDMICERTGAGANYEKRTSGCHAIMNRDEENDTISVEFRNLTNDCAEFLVKLCNVLKVKYIRGRCALDDDIQELVWANSQLSAELELPLDPVRYSPPDLPVTSDDGDYILDRDLWAMAVVASLEAGARLFESLDEERDPDYEPLSAFLRARPDGDFSDDIEGARREWLDTISELFGAAARFARTSELREAKKAARIHSKSATTLESSEQLAARKRGAPDGAVGAVISCDKASSAQNVDGDGFNDADKEEKICRRKMAKMCKTAREAARREICEGWDNPEGSVPRAKRRKI